jgi:hypothetical protein
MNSLKKQTPPQPPTLEKFEFSSPNFEFTKAETSFVRKILQRKYPAVMSDFVEAAREMMEAIQIDASPKMQYEAKLQHNRTGTRSHPSEVLYTPAAIDRPDDRPLSAVVSIEGLSQERRDAVRQGREGAVVPNGVENLISILTGIEQGAGGFTSFINAKIKTIDLPFPIFASRLKTFLTQFRKEAVIYNFDIDAGENPMFFVEIGHASSQNHLLLVLFELEMTDLVICEDSTQ